MTIVEEITAWLDRHHPPSPRDDAMDDTEELIPVAGVGDWFKGKIKNILLAYAKPFWDDIKAAIQNRDFDRLADVIDKIGALAGYVEIAKAVSDVFRELAAGNYLAAVEKAIVAVRLILAMFPKAEAESGPIRLMAADATFEAEVDAMLNAAFPPPTLKAAGDGSEVGPDGKPVGFGIIEIAAIASLIWTAIQFIRSRREKKVPPVVG